jgi:TolA-binding protein
MSEPEPTYTVPQGITIQPPIPPHGSDAARIVELERQLHSAQEHINCMNILIAKMQANTQYVEGQREAWRQMYQDIKDKYDNLKNKCKQLGEAQ